MGLLLFLGGVVLLLLAVIYGSFVGGLVFYKFWYWFILPVFTTLPHITFLQAVGLMFFVSLFKTIPSQIIKEDYTDKTTATISQLIFPWIALFLGWIVKLMFLS